MLKIKNWTLFSPKKWKKKAGILTTVAKKNQFLQWILKDDDVYFKKIIAS